MTSLVQVLVVLVVVGVILWLVQTYIPMPAPFKVVINVVVVLFLCVWFLRIFGIVGPIVPVK